MYSYDEIIDKINHAHRFGNDPGVTITAKMLDVLGHPEKNFRFIHVAGTNGKGSTCAFLDRILRKAGIRSGLFTSPHLVEFEERIVVDGEMIPKEEVTRIGNFLMKQDFGVSPTYFDYCLAMAVIWFAEQGVEIAVMETGLGGTLDSTNALGKPLAAVIAKIGFDHMAILGNTLSAIASEKAGIMKEGCPAVLETQEPEAMEVLTRRAGEIGVSSLKILNREEIAAVSHLPLTLPGVHQWENGALAAATIRLLGRNGSIPMIPEEQITEGLCETTWPGRMELLSGNPFFMVDGAHNGHGVSALTESLKTLYPGEKFYFIMGVLADKDYESMVEQLLPLAEEFHTVTPESARALQAEDLACFIRDRGVPAHTLGGLEEVPQVLSTEGKNIAFGSLYFIGELKKLWEMSHTGAL